MASKPIKTWLYRFLLKTNLEKKNGFTLIELLVAIAIAGAIVTGLLFMVVEMLQMDQREFTLNQTQRDMKRAMEYMTRDVREAIYVYSTPTAVINQIPAGSRPAGTPILAFWRVDPVDFSRLPTTCSTLTTATKVAECDALKIRQGTNTLVVYYQQDNPPGGLWQGPSRITRYELTKYTATGLPSLTSTPGYTDPLAVGNSFKNWQGTTATQFSSGNVLADFVDAAGTQAATCPNNYQQTPTTGNSFFVCVRDTTPDLASGLTSDSANANQDLIVSLRGNARGDATTGIRPLNMGASKNSITPTLQSQILVRGVLEKTPD